MINSASVDKIRNIHRSSNLYKGKVRPGSQTNLRLKSAYSEVPPRSGAAAGKPMYPSRPGSSPINLLGSGKWPSSSEVIKIDSGEKKPPLKTNSDSIVINSLNESEMEHQAASKSKIGRVMSAVTKG